MLRIISEHGRHFFRHSGRVTRFDVDGRGRVWLVDKYTLKRIYMHQHGSWRGFSDGGTMKHLCSRLTDYIMGRSLVLPTDCLGPWPDDLMGMRPKPQPLAVDEPEDLFRSDLWGYGLDEMAEVRRRCVAIQRLP
jgi:hypothetical protein